MRLPLPRLLVILLLTLFVTSVAHANDPATRAAKRHFDRGEKLFALGKFDEALDEYQKAYDAKPLPDFLFNIGQCYRNLGDYEGAIFSFKKFLNAAPDAENREQVEEYIAELEAEQDKGNTKKFGFATNNPPPEEEERRPIYKKWWFWTGIAVVGVAGGIGIYAATRTEGPPMTDLGNIVFTK